LILRILAAGSLTLLALTGTALAQGTTVPPFAVKIANVADDAVIPGVKVAYWYAEFDHVDKFAKLTTTKQGWSPKPIAAVNGCDANGKLFDAGVIENYGIKGSGFLRFPKEGEWKIAVKSNDGVRLWLDGTVAVNDPEVHGSRMSKPAVVTVPAAGAVPFEFLYFQKKGLACLEMHWQGPGDAALTAIPASAYVHQKP